MKICCPMAGSQEADLVRASNVGADALIGPFGERALPTVNPPLHPQGGEGRVRGVFSNQDNKILHELKEWVSADR
jgi:hypothetical protein